jgi:membrane protease YdiL (CAAX protease family)
MVMLVLKATALAGILQVISAWTATFVFIAMFHKIYPQVNLKQYIVRQFSARIKLSTIIGITLLQSAILLICLFLSSTFGNVSIKSMLVTSWTTYLVAFGDNLIRGPLGEELGWRSFVLNELQKKYRPLKSAILVGVAWGFWHTPLWLLSGYCGIQLIIYIVCFLVYIIAASVMMTVFYNRNHNLLVPIIMHQFMNYFLAIQTGDILQKLMVTAIVYLSVTVVIVLANFKSTV